MPALVRITPWPDPVLDALGHDPRSWYAETFWLPTLGPTALLLLRHLADRFEEHPQGLTLPVADTAAALGLGPRDGEQSPLVRSLNRLQQFDLAHAARSAGDRGATHAAARSTAGTCAACPSRSRRGIASGSQARRRATAWTRRAGAPGASRSRCSWTVNRSDTVERALHRSGFHPALGSRGACAGRSDRHEDDRRPRRTSPRGTPASA